MYSNPYSSKSSHKKVVFRSDGRVIGNLVGDTLIKSVYGSRHMLRTPKSWAVDTVSVMQAKEAGAKYIEIRDRETGRFIVLLLKTSFALEFTLTGDLAIKLPYHLKDCQSENPVKALQHSRVYSWMQYERGKPLY